MWSNLHVIIPVVFSNVANCNQKQESFLGCLSMWMSEDSFYEETQRIGCLCLLLSASPQCCSSSFLQCQQCATQPNTGLEVDSANINKGLTPGTTQTPIQTPRKNKKNFYLGKPVWPDGSVTDVEGELGSTLAGRPTHEGTKQGINRA